MKMLFTVLAFAFAIVLTAQTDFYHVDAPDRSSELTNPFKVEIYALAGVAGYDFPRSNPFGKEYRAGFLADYKGVLVTGGGGYNSFKMSEGNGGYYNFEAGLGHRIFPQFGITVGFSYFNFRGSQNGRFGLMVRPWLDLYEITPRLKVKAVSGLAYTGSFVAWSGTFGLSYEL